MTGYRSFTKSLASAIRAGAFVLTSLLLLLVSLVALGSFVLSQDAYAQSDQPPSGHVLGFIQSKAKAGKQEDSDAMQCFNKNEVNWQGVGFFAFSKSTESSGKSNFFVPRIKVRYASWGWIPFTNNYYKIQNQTADLAHSECKTLIGVRFCARYASPAGTQAADGSTIAKTQYGYKPGNCACRPLCSLGAPSTDFSNPDKSPCCDATDLADPNNTCCAANDSLCAKPEDNAKERKDTCVSPLRFKTSHVTRLCAYEDAWDLGDQSTSSSPFHKLDDACAGLEGKAKDQCVNDAVIRYAVMGALLGGPGSIAALVVLGPIGLIGLAIGAAIGAAIGYFTGGAFNYDVMTTSLGTSLGCVDIDMAPPPPVFFYTLQSGPPRPRVVAVSDNVADFDSEIAKYQTTLTVPLGDPGHPESWHYETNKDWFYPKIGVVLGDTQLTLQADGSSIYTPSTKRAARVLTGDFYGENTARSSGDTSVAAGNGRYAALDPLLHAEGADSRQVINAPLSINIEQDDGSTVEVKYNITTEVHDEQICAYIVGENFTVTGKTPSSPDNPELIGCVDRPQSYYAMYDDITSPQKFKKGDLIEGTPYPQIFHPWFQPGSNPRTPWPIGSSTPSTSSYDPYAQSLTASTYKNKKYFWWLVHDPRRAFTPASTANYDSYEEYRADDSVASETFANSISNKVTIPDLACDSSIAPEQNPITGETMIWPAPWLASPIDLFGRDENRNHRIHGTVYCVTNYDKNKNGKIDIEDSDLCAQYSDSKSLVLEKLERPGAVPVGYAGVEVTATKIKIPDPFPRQAVTAVPPGGSPADAIITFPGTTVNVTPGTLLTAIPNTLDSDGNYKLGIRFYSANPTDGCNKKVDSTGAIVDDICPRELVDGASLYFRDPPDPLRGEQIITANGLQMLVRRKYGTSTNPATTYPTQQNRIPYSKTADNTVTGECPLVLLSDGLTFNLQMPPDGCCTATAAECSDPSKWVDPSQRRYTMPDILRGQTVREADAFESGVTRGYCAIVPPSGCPSQAGDPGTNVNYWSHTFANYTTNPHQPDSIGIGIGEGECMPGYGGAKQLTTGGYSTTEGTFGQTALRQCNARNATFSNEGEWGAIIRPCLPLYCGSDVSYLRRDRDCLGSLCTTYTFKCDWSKTQALQWREADDVGHGDGHCRECNGPLCTDGAHTEWRVKYCGENGQWRDYTCRGNGGWPAAGTEDPGCSNKINDK